MTRRPDDPEALHDPARLVDDASSSEALRRDLAHALGAPPRYDRDRGLAALQAAIAVGAGATIAGSASTAASSAAGAAAVAKSSVALKLALAGGAGAVALAGAVAWSALHDPREAPPRDRPAQQAPAPVPPIVAPAPAPIVAPAPEPAIEPAPVPQPQAVRDRAAAEIAQLAEIKALVDAAPARALRLAEQGHRAFGEGYLHHEREGLAIVALHALGRDAEAAARAERFLVRYPKSPLSDRVRALMNEEPSP